MRTTTQCIGPSGRFRRSRVAHAYGPKRVLSGIGTAGEVVALMREISARKSTPTKSVVGYLAPGEGTARRCPRGRRRRLMHL